MPDTVQDLIRQAATTHGVPAELALAVAEQESGFNPTLINPKKVGDEQAIGTFQFLPSTAKRFGIDPNDPRQNIDGGARYLRELMDRHQGDLNKVLAEYGGVKTDTTYVPSVMARIPKFKQAPAAAVPTATSGALPGAPPPPAAGRGTAATNIGADAYKNAQSFTRAFDPRLPEGRNNIVAGVGAAASTALTIGLPEVGLLPVIARVLTPILGAATAGAGERAIEESAGTVAPGGVIETGIRQGAMEAIGQGFMWGTQRMFRSAVAPKVATATEAKLKADTAAVRASGTAAVHQTQDEVKIAQRILEDSARIAKQTSAERAGAHVTAAKDFAGSQVRAARQTSAGSIRAARRTAAEQLAKVEANTATIIADVDRQFNDLLAHVPSEIGSGEVVRATLQGPTRKALEIAGQRVNATAMDATNAGLGVPAAEFKEILANLAEQYRPSELYRQAGVNIPAAAVIAPRPVGAGVGPRISIDEYRALLDKTLKSKDLAALPGVLGKVQEFTDETIPFDVAHKVKMLLDSSVSWDRTAKSVLERVTKAARISLREMMPEHEGYDAATAAYQAVVPLYRKGIGQRLIKAANTPDGLSKLAGSLAKADTSQAMALRQLLVDQAAAGGDALAGQRAWNAVRGRFTHDTLLSGGVKGLQERVQTLITQRPEFVRTIYGDTSGQQVLRNLGSVIDAYTGATTRIAEETAATTAAGKAGVDTARATGQSAIEAAKLRGSAGVREAKAVGSGAKGATAETLAAQQRQAADAGTARIRGAEATAATQNEGMTELTKRFDESTLKKFMNRSVLDTIATGVQATALGFQSYWGAKAAIRLLQAPSSADLLEWAAYSTPNTVKLVNMLEGKLAPAVAADVLREVAGIAGLRPMPAHSGPSSMPPARAAVTAPVAAH